jgi:hypothetical protein
MEIRIRDVPAESRAAAMDFVNEYEELHMSGRKPGMANGKGWLRGSGKIWVYHTKSAIILTFLPST